MSSPKQVTELLAAERFDAAMDALLGAWRTHRSPQLERAIASLSEALISGVEPFDADAEDWQEQWERRARAKRALELDVLLPHLLRAPKGGIPRRVRGLLGFGGDPRIGALLVEMIETPPTTASSNFSMWTELFAALPEHVDARARPRLEARIATRGGKSNFWTKLEAWVKAALPKLPEAGRLPKGWKAELAELERAIAALARGPAPDLQVVAAAPEPDLAEVDELAEVRKPLEAGDLAGALDLLVSYWGQRRSPKVAALIDRLGVLVDEDQGPPRGKTAKDRQAAWIEAAERPRPRAIGPLLASLRDAKLVDVEARLETLSAWQPDPRVAQAMLMFVKDHMIGARNRLWKAVYDALVHHADPRVAAELRRRHERLQGANVMHRHISEGRELRRVFEDFVAAVEVEHELTSDQVEHAEAIASILAERVEAHAEDAGDELERSLVEAILAAWDDDGPRLVYSDWLQARRDPRGEFIALDVALAQGEKVKGAREKYFKANKEALLGPLASLIDYREKFERGLLIGAMVTTRKGGLDVAEDRRRETLGDLRWATLRSLSVSYDDLGAAVVFEHAPLLSLEQLERPGLAALQGFARRKDTVPLRTLSVSGKHDDTPEDWEAFGALARVLPKVESIELMIWAREGGRVTPPLACFRGELVRRARELRCGSEISGGMSRLDEWLERIVASECPVAMVRLIGPELSAEVHQVELGRFEIDLTLDRLRWPDRREFQDVLTSLRELPRDRVASLRLTLGSVTDELRPEIDAALAGLPVEQLVPPE
ncbi:MAG: TIGR02996 domain-containing protein [Enhygromyxa sp.]